MDYPYALTDEDKKRVSLNPSQKSKFIDHLEQKLKKQMPVKMSTKGLCPLRLTKRL